MKLWFAHQPGIAGEGETVKMGARADRGEQDSRRGKARACVILM
jgi:hypothetical protein